MQSVMDAVLLFYPCMIRYCNPESRPNFQSRIPGIALRSIPGFQDWVDSTFELYDSRLLVYHSNRQAVSTARFRRAGLLAAVDTR